MSPASPLARASADAGSSHTVRLRVPRPINLDRLRLYSRLRHQGLARVLAAWPLADEGYELELELSRAAHEPDPARLLAALALLHEAGLGYAGHLYGEALMGGSLLPSAGLLKSARMRLVVPLQCAAWVAPETLSGEGGPEADVYALARALDGALPDTLAAALTRCEISARPSAGAALRQFLAARGRSAADVQPGFKLGLRESEAAVLSAWLHRARQGESILGFVVAELGSGLETLADDLRLEASLGGFAATPGGDDPQHVLALENPAAPEGESAASFILRRTGAIAATAAADAGVIRLERLDAEALAASVFIPAMDEAEARRLAAAAAAEAQGLPGVLVDAVSERLGYAERPFATAVAVCLRGLGGGARRVVETLAVAEASVSTTALRRAVAVDDDAWGEALASGLMLSDGAEVALVHVRACRAVRERLGAGRAIALSRRLAEEALATAGDPLLAARLWLVAGQAQRALGLALDEARRARQAGEPRRAAELLALLQAEFPGEPPRELLLERALLARALGRRAEAAGLLDRALVGEAWLEQAAEIARLWLDAGDAASALAVATRAHTAAGRRSAAVVVVEGEALYRSGRAAEARAALEAILPGLEAGSEQEADAFAALGLVLGCGGGPMKRAYALLGRALAAYRRAGNMVWASRALSRIGNLLQRDGRLAAAAARHFDALAGARAARDLPGEAECHVDLGVTLFELGEVARSRLHFEQAATLFEALDDARGFTLGRANLAAADLMLGHGRDAEQTLLACLASNRACGLELHAALDEKFLARAALQRRDLASARSRLDRAERVFRDLGDEVELADAWEIRGLIEIEEGRSAQAVRAAEAGLRAVATTSAPALRARLELLLARATLLAHGADAAEPLVRRLKTSAAPPGQRLVLEGHWLLAVGRGEEARAVYERGLEALESAEDVQARFAAYLEYLDLFGPELDGPRRACLMARLGPLARELGAGEELARRGLAAKPAPRRALELGRDGLVGLASLRRGQGGDEALLSFVEDSVATARAAVLREGADGLRVVVSRPAGPNPRALALAARALATGRPALAGDALAAPGVGLVVWVERAQSPWSDEEQAFVAAVAELAAPELDRSEPASPPVALGHDRIASAFVGESTELRAALALLARVAVHPVPVFVGGESGTGKELAAREIHRLSGRAGEFVAVNCAAVPEALFESELFGHLKGAFSGATQERDGLIESADRGTLFLDEVGDLPVALQAKLLRALDAGEVRRVGENRSRRVDVRVVSATNRDLDADLVCGRFRADLYYRLVQVRVDLPALRQRGGDVALLARTFVRSAAADLKVAELRFTPRALARLEAYDWPGNVRELMGVVRSLTAAHAGEVVDLEHLPLALRERLGSELDLSRARHASEKDAIVSALDRTRGNRTEAARLLGIARQTLVKRIRSLGLAGQV